MSIFVKTISPITIPDFLAVGINTHSQEYLQLLSDIDQVDENTISFNIKDNHLEYQNLDQDFLQ